MSGEREEFRMTRSEWERYKAGYMMAGTWGKQADELARNWHVLEDPRTLELVFKPKPLGYRVADV